MSDNWVVATLEDALSNWNDKLAEIWSLVSQTPESFRGGEIWTVIVNIHNALVGSEESSEVNGTSVTAGYFVTDRNSVGEQNVIYYATFKLGDSTVYVENAGAKTESESVKNDLATIIQELINNGALDLSSFNG